jgi:hypothetical protein
MSDIYSGSPYRYTSDQWADRCFRTEPRPVETVPAEAVSPHPPTSSDWREQQGE